MKPDIFTYLDFRGYLQDAFDTIKAQAPRLSYRNFANRSGFSTPNFLQMVIQGKRNLNSTHTVLVTKAFKLNKQESDFFQNLVGFGQARSQDAKNIFYQRILKNKRYTPTKILDRSQNEYYAHWYVPVVRELIAHRAFDGTPEWIAGRVFPRITQAQAGSAIRLLETLGLIRPNPAGKWSLTDVVVSTDSEPDNLALRDYHSATIQLGREALKAFSQQERDIRSITIGLSDSAFAELKDRLESTWKAILDFAGSQTVVDKVYQINFQLFPLIREIKGPNAA